MISNEKFLKYEKVRNSGQTNMFDVKVVCLLSGLCKSEVLDIMQNYSSYKERSLALEREEK